MTESRANVLIQEKIGCARGHNKNNVGNIALRKAQEVLRLPKSTCPCFLPLVTSS